MKYEQRVVVFRQRLQQVVDHSGLNYSGFAKSIGVERSTLSQLFSVSNLRLPRADTIAGIAERYQVSIDWLLGLTDKGTLSPDVIREPLEWHREAGQHRVRYIPITIPDLFKTEEVAAYEFKRYGLGKTDQSIRDTHRMLIHHRQEESEMEVCQSIQDIEGFALGEGIWAELSARARREQLEHIITLLDELYPGFRWYLFDGRQMYTAAFTVFGPLRVAVFTGQMYLVLNSREHIRLFSNRFDKLICGAVVQPNEAVNFVKNQWRKVK
ncbi:MAG: transcriptional regulator [Gammaproteobacteria bacterium]|nr:transcriptional regulator [Gammaproteobacteria bacterium]